jgi:hypothetical protein
MSETIALPAINSEAFWAIYDEFCHPVHLEGFINTGESHRAPQMRSVMETAHKDRAIHRLSRVERGWENHKAWLALRDAPIRNDRGDEAIYMRVGDVIVVEWGWDRDVIITHNPIPRNIVCGYLLSGRWEEMVGLFMPLFDRRTIFKCIELRTAKNVREATQLAEEESRDWGWK